MFFGRILAVAAFATSSIHATPVQELDARNLTPENCSKVVVIVDVLKTKKATKFCSEFLAITPVTSTSTIQTTATQVVTTTSTITSGATSTSLVFKPGTPQARVRRDVSTAEPLAERRDTPLLAHERRDSNPDLPSYMTAYPTSEISSACSCLNIPTSTKVKTKSGKITTTLVVTTTTTVTPSVVTSTKYPCASPIFPTRVPTFPFGDPVDEAGVGDTNNSRYTDTTLEDCCNLCYFTLPNCIGAYYYSYQGCVVRQANAPSGTGVDVSSVCPNGKINGLTYGPDLTPDIRSQGSLAGPCGETYNNL